VTWFHPLWRHGLQRPDFQIERGGVSQTGALLLRSDNDPEPDERITVTGQRIGQRVRQRCQEPKNDFLASMCPKWVPHTLSASQIRTYDERVRNPTRALMAAGTPVFSTSCGPSFSDHFYPARRGIDCGPRRSTAREQWPVAVESERSELAVIAAVSRKRQNEAKLLGCRHGSKAGYSSGVGGIDARRATPPDPMPPRWGLAGCCQLDPSHPTLVTCAVGRAGRHAPRPNGVGGQPGFPDARKVVTLPLLVISGLATGPPAGVGDGLQFLSTR